MKIYSHSQNATARLFLLESLFDEKNKNIIITDNTKDFSLLENFWKKIWNTHTEKINHIGELLALENTKSGIFFCHTDIFRETGNMYHIKKTQSLHFSRGEKISMTEIIDKLIAAGYDFSEYIWENFSYKKEGWLLNIIAWNTDFLYQIEWFDDEIDAILSVQNSTKNREFINEITLPFHKNQSTEENFIKINTELLTEIPKIFENKNIFLLGCDFLEEIKIFQNISNIHFSELGGEEKENLWIQNVNINTIHDLIHFLERKKSEKIPVKIFTKYHKTVEDFLKNNSIDGIEIFENNSRGLESFENIEKIFCKKMVVITDDILGKIFVKSRKSGSIAKNLDLLISLLPGDFVVHRDHGIGKFHAIIKKTLGDIEREYLELHYAENDKLFVPITEIFRISKYLGSQDVTLTRLGGKEWEKTLSKTDEELQKIAENILETNAKRSLATGRAFAKFPLEEAKFREKFPYEYTVDQYNGIMDIFADMEKDAPMDRLLSGDVGFWKTEIAMNAAFKAVLNGTQVAVISPLVVLAMEHYESFIERFSDFGVNIALLSRMNTAKEAEKILNDMKNGNVDIVIGTHRLLSEDVKWKKLGLLIIDEEHKFGVTHKEKIKQLRAGIDILALSATPIPRSLNLALSGLRQISLLSTPPKKKKPIETIITNWNESIVKNAIFREFERGGQVLIIHNRIAGIESLKQELEEILSESETEAKIIITHGRMTWDEIEDRIHDFKEKKYNILLTTTIIENGVNFLSANTIIIIDPEDFGMASLHQLRGRVGRKGDQWYCYLAYRKTTLSPEEKERLITIANNNHLGAGFEIAMRDMEIRGAGDILGIKQSGKSKEVWLPLYFRMLEEKIAELKQEKSRKIFTKIELELSYILKDEYFSSELDKLNFFREAENIDSLEELENLKNEFYTESNKNDGNLENLFLLLESRIIFWEFGVEKISKIGNFYTFDFKKWNSVLELKNFLEIFDPEKNMIVVTPEKLRIDAKTTGKPKDFLKKFLQKH